MEIIIPIKQVPETSNVKMDPETGTMVRGGVESIINPLDLYAIELGIQLVEENGGSVKVITMGPPSAEKALREAIAMGCDDGVLISGREFAGADSWSTAYVLGSIIKELGDFDLVLTGERATDGDTGQVGPGIASFLDIPLSTYTSKILEVSDNSFIVERLVEEGYERLRLLRPSLLTVVKEISYPRLPTLRGKQKAKKMDVPIFSNENVEMDKDKLGLQGSPTRVVKIDRPKVARNAELIKANNQEKVEKAVAKLIGLLKEKEII
ncbi:MAG: electron transfer flavoprotein subunit beta/FixA family protein [Firmicutes bacterium]|nr:electron transfer flavoprotein subunit beta/FixA family protein [Bacillota bacterium]